MSRRWELVAFFLLAFGFTWACWIAAIFVRDTSARHRVALAGQFGPLIAATLITGVSSGRAGLRRFVGSFVNWRFNFGLAFFALLLPPVAYSTAIALKSWYSGEAPPAYSYRLVYDVLVNFFLVILWGGPLGEEPGWRGYALPRLQSLCGPTAATLVLGVLWACWHFPRWWMAGEFPLGIVGMFVLALVAFSFVFTFLYNQARGSILPCLLLHGSANTFYVILPVEWAWGAWTIVICSIAAIMLLMARNRGASPAWLPADSSHFSGSPPVHPSH